MNRLVIGGMAVLVCVAGLAGCASRPIDLQSGVGGDGVATLAADGSIRVRMRTADADGMASSGVVVFKPGDPAYETMKAEVEQAWPAKRKPTLTWEIGTPVYGP